MEKKEIKQAVKAKFEEDKAALKARKSEIKAMEKAEAKLAKSEDKKLAKTALKARKSEIKAMTDAEKKEAKYFDKKYKKQKTKTRRWIGWGVFALIFLGIFTLVSPIINEVREISDSPVSTESAEAKAAKESGTEVAKSITAEGLVLLENKDNVLPLKGDKKINVFGFGAMNYKMGGGGSGATNLDEAVNLYAGLQAAGISYNEALYDFYVENKDMVDAGSSSIWIQMLDGILGSEKEAEPENTDYITDDVIEQAKGYSDTALIVVTSMSSEASDATVEKLEISDAERALIERVTNEFDNVIILVNAGYAMDLNFIDEYDNIKSVMWIGNPGAYGALSIGNTLAGEINPSGRLNDTYVKDIAGIPAVQNTGNYQYANIDGIGRLDYEEGIYVGYRYYETRYADDEKAYDAAVRYPFGYGISYTTFNQEIVKSDVDDDKVKLSVKVTNTGKLAGKEVVQLYYTAPYTEGGIEKASKNLVAFDKTESLEPGKSETVEITFDIKDMSSWDMENANYLLEKGKYTITLGKDAHDNFDSFTWDNDKKVVYAKDEETGTEYSHLFDNATGDLTYMSRADFDGTFPSDSDVELTAPEDVVDAFYAEPKEVEGTEAVTGEDNGIMLSDLEGLDFDDKKWEEFLNQFTIDDMIGLVSYGGYHTREIENLGVPRTDLLDGPAGWNRLFGGSIDAASYPSELLISSTWNVDLAYALGDAIGKEGAAYGIDMWYAPAMNVHRSPIGGRNYEYFSEDPVISGKMAAGMVKGAQGHNIMVSIKHFALNEQEVNARSGVIVWANEQALREIYLKPFEIATKESNPTGAMSSFINIGPVWAGGNDELLNKLLRNEWGFEGIVSTDAQLGSWMDPVDAVINGNELMLSIFKGASNEKKLTKAYKEMPVLISNSLRDRTHTIMYNIVNHTNMPEGK